MKIDSKLTFVRIVASGTPIDGEFQIVKGVGELASELFVVGTAHASLQDGTKVAAPIVYPYRTVERLIIELPKPVTEQDTE